MSGGPVVLRGQVASQAAAPGAGRITRVGPFGQLGKGPIAGLVRILGTGLQEKRRPL
jgi:hypothetical protein